MADLNHTHHAFIQALMSRGPLSEDDAKSMFRVLSGDGNSDAGFPQFVADINKELDFVQMELRASRNQYNGVAYYGVVNRLANEQAKMGTRYSHAQIAFFKAMLEAIVSDPTGKGQISSMHALNLRLDSQNEQHLSAAPSQTLSNTLHLTIAQKEKTLSELVNDKWMSRTEDGMVALGVRAFLELWSIFKNFDVPFCDVCNEAGIKAQPCRNEECTVRIHDYCLQRRFHRRQVARVCPKCGTEWGQVENPASNMEEVPSLEDIPEVSPVLRRPRSRLGVPRRFC
eukprot:c19312_g1_i1 orf=390-1241(-)